MDCLQKGGVHLIPDIHRAKDFNNALKDKETNAIICLRGGYGTLRIMDLIEWSLYLSKMERKER